MKIKINLGLFRSKNETIERKIRFMETISVPKDEYLSLKKENELLKDQEILKKMNLLIDLMFEIKYGLYMGDYTEDLTTASIDNLSEWQKVSEAWNEV